MSNMKDNEQLTIQQNPESQGPLLSVIMPVFNEKDTILEILDRVKSVPIDKEIIVVDDYSTDGTRNILSGINDGFIRVFFHEKNKGKGAAVRTGIEQIKGQFVLIQDADLEYSPEEYPRLLKPIFENHADVVYGSRFLGDERRVLYYWHTLGNRCLTLLSNVFTNLNLTDMETCYKVFRAPILKQINIESDRFGMEPEITAKIAKMKCRIYEIPITYHGRDYSEGKKITWRDAVSAVACILKFNLLRRKGEPFQREK